MGKIELDHAKHEIDPVYNKDSNILILGTFPSVKSREQKFFYGHPQNRFWKVLSGLFSCKVPVTIEEKKKLLLEHQVAVWDVIQSCDISGSSDSSIKNVEPSDLNRILKIANIRKIFVNGQKAYTLYEKYCKISTGMEAIKLPSTSPANAAYSLERLMEEWREILL